MSNYSELNWNLDDKIDKIIAEFDETYMPLPDIEFEPQLLISKVRKHYMEYMIRLLSVNYETNQKLVNKNIYLPSAIWRCAKNIEMKAAQTCMVVQLYRKYIVSVIKEVKKDTQKGRLNSKLFECLHKAPRNEKKVQTIDHLQPSQSNCHCHISNNKRRRKQSYPSESTPTESQPGSIEQSKNIPVLINMQIDQVDPAPTVPVPTAEANTTTKPITNNSESDSDEVMIQLEKLFHSDDELFEGTLLDNIVTTSDTNQESNTIDTSHSIIDSQINSLDERLSGMLVNVESTENPQIIQPKKRKYASKWVCEEYYMKKDLYDLLYQIGDSNRKKLSMIKNLYVQLFGDDSDDEEDILSPIAETTEFIQSCKSRISSWVVTSLNPYYARGRIRGKTLYKALAKHLIELIFRCKQYPSEHEVKSFVFDFLENHDMIRCEADFKEFRINNS